MQDGLLVKGGVLAVNPYKIRAHKAQGFCRGVIGQADGSADDQLMARKALAQKFSFEHVLFLRYSVDCVGGS